MKEFNSLEEILDFAIGEEQAAIDFYQLLSLQTKNQEMKKIFQSYAEEEMKHKSKLLEVKSTGINTFSSAEVMDLKIADYLIEIKPEPDMSYQDALILAMKKEKSAFKLYSALSERTDNQEMKELFQLLALEESKHKLRFELEYDDYILREN